MYIKSDYFIAVLSFCVFSLGFPVFASESSLVEGYVHEVSELQDPKESDYPDCYYIVGLQIKNVLSGTTPPEFINLAVPGFVNYEYTKSTGIKNGDKLRAVIVDSAHISEKEATTQQSDDFNRYDRETYFLRSCEHIKEWTAMPAPNFGTKRKYVSLWSSELNEPHSSEVASKRLAAIAADLKKLGQGMQENSIPALSLQQNWEEQQTTLPQIKPGFYWLQKGSGVFALPKDLKPFWDCPLPPSAVEQNLPAISALNVFLKNKNVDLIVVLYPEPFSLAIRAFRDETVNIPIRDNVEISSWLLRHGIEVVDLSEEMVKLIPDSEFLLFYYHLNGHPGWETQDLAGRLVAERLARYQFDSKLDAKLFEEKRVVARNPQYTYPHALPIGSGVAGTPVMTNGTFYNGESTVTNPESPILLWGNSFLAWPKNQALVTAVAKYSLVFPEFRGSSGCFTSMLKDLLLAPEHYIMGKRVFVMPISVSMLKHSKFWNIQDLDRRFLQENLLERVIEITLPLEIDRENCRNLLEEADSIGLQGHFYDLNRQTLQLPVPVIETVPGYTYKLRVVFYNNASMYCRYGDQSCDLNSSSVFMLDTIEFDYHPDNSVIKFIPKGTERQMVISKAMILEYNQELK